MKNAFLVGRVLIISPEHVGENSFVSGFESRASGSYSQAMGFKTMATGNYSTAIGVNAASTNTNSFAFGDSPVASGADSYAFGAGAIASGRGSYALGSFGRDASGNLTPIKTTASGDYSFALGLGSVASGLGAFTFGASDTAAGWFSTVTGIWNKVEPGGVCAMANGIGTKAGNYAAAAFGDHTYASGHTSFATGYKTTAAGQWSATLGGETIANGVGSIAAGYGSMVESTGYGGIATGYLTKAGNWVAAAFGDQTYASGHTSFATGFKTTALGHTSSTFGESTTANGYASVAFGRGTVAQTFGSMAIGNYNAIIGPDEPNAPWNFWEPVLSIGNGTSPEERSNAMTVYNSGIADFQGFINLSTNSYFSEAIRVRDAQALWYNGTYFSWGYGGNYNVFADHVSVGTTASPGTYALYVAGNAMTTGTWGTSDIRWKKNLVPLKNVLRDINKLEPVSYNWRTDEFPDMDFDEGNQIGLVAQDVEKIFPDLVKSDANGFKAVAYDKLSVVLLQAIREQQQHIKSQDDKIARLEALVNRLMTE